VKPGIGEGEAGGSSGIGGYPQFVGDLASKGEKIILEGGNNYLAAGLKPTS
jgi:hypothetical protein